MPNIGEIVQVFLLAWMQLVSLNKKKILFFEIFIMQGGATEKVLSLVNVNSQKSLKFSAWSLDNSTYLRALIEPFSF